MVFEKSNSEDLFTEKYKTDASCIIPAAGFSSRMGSWKGDLTTRDGIPFIQNAIATALSACFKVIVVGGYRFSRVMELVSHYKGVTVIENTDFEKGMLNSIQCGLEYVEEDFFILPMDMPLIDHQCFAGVRANSVTGKICRPVFRGVPGHPVLFPAVWRESILSMNGKSLGKQIKKDDLFLIPWKDASVITDMDSMTDYRNYLDQEYPAEIR